MCNRAAPGNVKLTAADFIEVMFDPDDRGLGYVDLKVAPNGAFLVLVPPTSVPEPPVVLFPLPPTVATPPVVGALPPVPTADDSPVVGGVPLVVGGG